MREIPLTKDLVAIVDAADFDALAGFRWRAISPNGRSTIYAVANHQVHGRSATALMHRLIMQPLVGQVIDHINGDGLDNRRANLRICTNAQNLANRKKPKNNTTGFKGVSHYRTSFIASIGSDYIGSYETAEEAALAYDAAARQQFGEFANFNFPDRDDPTPPTRRQKRLPHESRVRAMAAWISGDMEQREVAQDLGVNRVTLTTWRKDAALMRDVWEAIYLATR